MYRVQLQAECIAGSEHALVFSLDYAFTVLVSKCIDKCKHLSAMNMLTLEFIVRVMEFSASVTPTCTVRTYASSTMSTHSGAETK